MTAHSRSGSIPRSVEGSRRPAACPQSPPVKVCPLARHANWGQSATGRGASDSWLAPAVGGDLRSVAVGPDRWRHAGLARVRVPDGDRRVRDARHGVPTRGRASEPTTEYAPEAHRRQVPVFRRADVRGLRAGRSLGRRCRHWAVLAASSAEPAGPRLRAAPVSLRRGRCRAERRLDDASYLAALRLVRRQRVQTSALVVTPFWTMVWGCRFGW